MDDFDLEIKNDFINEAIINLEEVESSFMELESSAETKPLLEKIFRMAHNLKGGSRAVGFGHVAEFTHELENLVLKIQKAEVTLSSDMISTLLKSNDRLIEMLMALKSDLNASRDNSDLIEELKAWSTGQRAPAPMPEPEPEPEPAAAEQTLQPIQEDLSASAPSTNMPPNASNFFASDDDASFAPPPTPVPGQAPAPEMPPPAETKTAAEPQVVATKDAKADAKINATNSNEKEDEIVRVSLTRINTLNDYVGELIVMQSVIQQQTILGNLTKANSAIQQMSKLSKEIQSISMGLRMIPVKPLIQKLQRVVRDTAKALSKQVQLNVEGDQLEIDKSVLDRLSDPLIHILRNAVDHGLETTDERHAAGKSTAGTVTLSFLNEGNHLLIQVRDDGKGINPEVLLRKAIEKGVVSASQTLTEKQIIHLVFHAGFSTKSETSEISGRGVGMDVVKTNIDRIGGKIEINTNVGTGTTFSIRIPLSLAVIDGLIVRSGKSRYAIPLSQVQETINLETFTLHQSKAGIGTCFELRGSIVPLITMETLLKTAELPPSNDKTALLFYASDQLVAVQISEVIQSQQVVVKPLGNGIKTQKGWIGSCVLGDGLPTLILSPQDLIGSRNSNAIGAHDGVQRRSA